MSYQDPVSRLMIIRTKNLVAIASIICLYACACVCASSKFMNNLITHAHAQCERANASALPPSMGLLRADIHVLCYKSATCMYTVIMVHMYVKHTCTTTHVHVHTLYLYMYMYMCIML